MATLLATAADIILKEFHRMSTFGAIYLAYITRFPEPHILAGTFTYHRFYFLLSL